MNTQYLTNGSDVLFIIKDENGETIKSGMFTEDYSGSERNDYLAWVAEGNTAEVLEAQKLYG